MHPDDWKCMALLGCVTFGVGSLGMTGVYAEVGPLSGTMALYFVSWCNLHASVVLSKAMLAAPQNVRTYGDLGHHLCGEWGHWVTNVTQILTCTTIPIAFLVLGGTEILPELVPQIVKKNDQNLQFVIIMAFAVLPIINIPTLRDTAGICVAGTIAALLCDYIALHSTLNGVPFEIRETDVQVRSILQVFGNISFAFGTASVVPAIQRQHHNPQRMPYLLFCSMAIITVLYSCIGSLSYFQLGCTAPTNLLISVPNGMWKKVAYGSMFVHILIAYAVTINPAVFIIERWILKMDADGSISQDDPYLNTPIVDENSSVSLLGGESNVSSYAKEDEGTRLTTRDIMLRMGIRCSIVFLQAILAILLRHSLKDVLNIIGATCVSISCLIAPCYFYIRMFGRSNVVTYALSVAVCIVGGCLSIYSTYSSINSILHESSTYNHHFSNINGTTEGHDKFPYCRDGEKN